MWYCDGRARFGDGGLGDQSALRVTADLETNPPDVCAIIGFVPGSRVFESVLLGVAPTDSRVNPLALRAE